MSGFDAFSYPTQCSDAEPELNLHWSEPEECPFSSCAYVVRVIINSIAAPVRHLLLP